MIDGSEDESNKQPDPGPHKDSWYLEELYKLARGYKVVVKAPEDLKKINLSPVDYPCLYLLDVPNLSDESLKKVEDYVEQGGRVAIFLGKHVQASFYNTKLWNNGNGIFPVPLKLQPESIDQLEHDKRLDERQYQVYLRDEGHPVLRDIADQDHKWLLKKLVIDTYWPAKLHTEWRADPSKVHELMTLPNRGELKLFDAAINAIREKLKAQDPKNAPFRGTLDYYEAKLARDSDESFNAASSTLDLLLNEHGNNAAQKLVDLGPFWEMPENADLHTQVADLRDTMRYGDPLMMSKSFGKGQTIVFMTTAGAHWNDWGTKSPAIHTYPLVMLNLQKYLTGVTTDSSRTVGTPWEYVVDADSVPGKDTRAAISFQAAPHGVFDRAKIDKAEVREKDLDTVEGVVEDNGKKIRYTFADTPPARHLSRRHQGQAQTGKARREGRPGLRRGVRLQRRCRQRKQAETRLARCHRAQPVRPDARTGGAHHARHEPDRSLGAQAAGLVRGALAVLDYPAGVDRRAGARRSSQLPHEGEREPDARSGRRRARRRSRQRKRRKV